MGENKLNNTLFTRTFIATAIALALAPANSYAGIKATDIKGLPQTDTITGIRSGKASNGDVVISWQTDKTLYAQRIFNTGVLNGGALTLAADAAASSLAVKSDNSFISAWNNGTSIISSIVAANAPGTPFTVGLSGTASATTQALSNASGFAVAWNSSLQNFDANAQPSPLENIGSFNSIAMDSAGDFIIARADTSGINVKNSKNQSIIIAPSQAIGSYDFDEGANINKSASFSISEPTVAINDSGDFVVAWIESKSESVRKKGKDICTNYYGERYCQPSFKVSSTNTSKLVARRYSNTLTPKENNPIVVANVKGSSLFVAEPEVALDADGDFTVAYTSGKGSTSGYSYQNTIAVEKDVFARQFLLNKNKKLVAGAAIKASSKPKVPVKHTLKNSVNSEPSLVVVNESKNTFILAWHNDYEDHYKDYENSEQVCAKFKTVKDGYGYSERVCANYKMVPADGSNNMSVLKAKRYGN